MSAADKRNRTAAAAPASMANHGSETQTHTLNSQLESETTSLHDTRTNDNNTIGAPDYTTNLSSEGVNKKPPPPMNQRTPSASHRRRHRPVQLMESISETGFGDSDNFEPIFVSSRHSIQNADSSNDEVSNESTSSSSSISSTIRRRSHRLSSCGNSSGSDQRRQGSGQNLISHSSGCNEHLHHERRRRSGNNSSRLAASLDSGMKSLRNWIRAQKFDVSNAAPADGSSRQRTMSLGEEDISALSRAGNDASSASGDSSPNDGFLYYRPYEVHVRHGVDTVVYSSDDGSSDLLFPLVNLGQDDEGGLRHRAYSEPDRAQVASSFFGTVYSSRAIDSGGSRVESPVTVRRNTVSHIHVTDDIPPLIEERNMTASQELEQMAGVYTTTQIPYDHASQLTTDSADIDVESFGNFESTALPGPASDGNNDDNAVIETIIDPDRDARTRWLQINRRFRCILSSVALIFSFLLVLFLISWVILIATYVLTLGKICDVPLKAYFWLATLQLALDFFRAEIMKWICRWRSDSRGGVPLRVLFYNIAYLVYAALVLRLGIISVFVRESTCYDTAPELFLASAVFVCMSLLAWTLIILGYLIPYATVAILLTRNGYFPNSNLDALDGIDGNRRGRLIRILPNNLSNPAPPECIEKLRVVLYDECNNSLHKECCICLQEYESGDGIVVTPCNHVFHKECCKEWLQLSRSCPICRRDIVEGLGEGSTLEEGSTSDMGNHRRNNREGRGTSPLGWQREAADLLQFLRRDQREPAET